MIDSSLIRLIADHRLALLALATVVSLLACNATVALMARGRSAKHGVLGWLVAASLLFGGAVWSLHFIAMLAAEPWAFASHALMPALVCAAVPIVGALVAVASWLALPPWRGGVALSGAMMGLSIAGTHFGSMVGLDAADVGRLDRTKVLSSIAFAIVSATVAMARAGRLETRARRAEVALWLTLGIVGLHLLGMSAMHMQADMQSAAAADPGLAVFVAAVGALSLILLLLSLAATLVEKHLSQRAVLELARLRRLSEISHESVIIHREGIIIQANSASGRLFGVPPARLTGKTLLDLIIDSDRAAYMRASAVPPEQAPHQVHIKRFDGQAVPVEFSCNPIDYDGEPAHAIILTDLTDRKRDEAWIRHLAHHDGLTNLPNRTLLRTRIACALDGDPGTGLVALFYMDLDRFKNVNEVFGHATGDLLLQQVAGRLSALLQPGDTLARVGGDEFVALVRADDHNEIRLLAACLVDAIERPFILDDTTAEIGVSIGIALYPENARTENTLVQAADWALHHAKRERSAFRFFEPAMEEHQQAQHRLEQDLRHALERNELTLHYQPQVSCRNGAIESYEALLRWNHPVHGIIRPADFIPLAEETGQIRGIGAWAIESACMAAAQWPGGHQVAVNISPIQFRQHDIASVIVGALARSGLPASRLEIEITESVLLHDPEIIFRTLSDLRAFGIKFALDDFGTGYSSLSYLTSFRFDRIKIDQSFIRKLGQGDEAQAIVRAIIGLAHNLGSSVTAEGVETSEQLARVSEAGCDSVQGYLIGRPMEIDHPVHSAAAISTGVQAMLAGARLVDVASSAR